MKKNLSEKIKEKIKELGVWWPNDYGDGWDFKISEDNMEKLFEMIDKELNKEDNNA